MTYLGRLRTHIPSVSCKFEVCAICFAKKKNITKTSMYVLRSCENRSRVHVGCAAIVVVVTCCQLVHHGVMASASYRFSQYS